MDENTDGMEASFLAYLNRKMDPKAMVEFETRLAQEPELNTDFESFLRTYRSIHMAGYMEERKAWIEKSKALHRQRAKTQRLRIGLAVAAAAVAILCMFVLLNNPKTYSGSEIYAEYYQPLKPTIIMGEAAEEQANFQRANLAFSQEKYAEALTLYQQIDTDSLSAFEASQLALFMGISHLEEGNNDQARIAFKGAIQHQDQASWYTALSWLAEDTEQAIPLLQAITDSPQHFYQKQATEILKKLKP